MIERVERVTRVNGISMDTDTPAYRKEGFQDGRSKQSFSQVLQQEVKKADEEDRKAYELTLLRPTQSYFYTGEAKLAPGLPLGESHGEG